MIFHRKKSFSNYERFGKFPKAETDTYPTLEMLTEVDDDLATCFARKRRCLPKNVVNDNDLMDGNEELEISRAVLVKVDGRILKGIDEIEYNRVVCFARNCRKRNRIQLFRHPGDPRMSILGSYTLQTLKGKGCDLAVMAIKEYQKINKKVKLKLRDLMRINFDCDGRTTYYMTFSAQDEKTREIKTYQAALTEYFDGHLLGLFRNIVDDKVLAILSVKGTKEHLELRRARFQRFKKKFNREKRCRWGLRDEESPLSYRVESGEVDISGSALLEVDGPNLKKMDLVEYENVLEFAAMCRQKYCLEYFCERAESETCGMGAYEGDKLRSEGGYVADAAIEEYQKVKQNTKLNLRDIMKFNFSGCGGFFNYITFSAEDEMTGEVKTYQAALTNDENVLGLFRDLVDDKILAILSVKGTKEDLAVDEEDEYWRMLEERPPQEE